MTFSALKRRASAEWLSLGKTLCRCALSFWAWVLPLAAHRYPEYPVRPVQEYSGYQTESGVSVAVQPVIDGESQKRYLGLNLTAKHYLPVVLILENRNTEDSVIVQREEIELFDQEGERSGERGTAIIRGVSRAGQAVAAAAIPAAFVSASVPALLIAEKLIAITSEVRHNLLQKELRTQMLLSGKSAYGFLYLPARTAGSPACLRVSLRFSQHDKRLIFTLPLPTLLPNQ